MSDGQIKSYFDRWQRLEEEKAALSEDLKELFAEAKSNGYEPKAMRIAFKGKIKDDERTPDDEAFDAVVETYRSALDGPRARPAPAHEKTLKNFGSYADAKLVETVVQGVQTETGRKALVTAIDAMIEREEADPETGEILESVQSHDALGPSAPAESASGEISEPNTSVESRERQKAGEPVSKPEATPKERSLPSVGPSGTAASNSSSEKTSCPQHEVWPGSTSPGTEQECDTLGVTAGETATNSNPQASPSRQADKAETAPPVVSAAFTNPKCLKPKTCPNAHSKTACFDCVMEYGKRPREEQKRLWAEATGVAA